LLLDHRPFRDRELLRLELERELELELERERDPELDERLRPEPDFLPPPDCLLTVAHAKCSASFFGVPRDS
jgi:hypothetical protein